MLHQKGEVPSHMFSNMFSGVFTLVIQLKQTICIFLLKRFVEIRCLVCPLKSVSLSEIEA